MQTLQQKATLSNGELVVLAKQLGVEIPPADTELLTKTASAKAAQPSKAKQTSSPPAAAKALHDARERLLLKLDVYEALRRSRFSQNLAQISVVLSIISALLSIYADALKISHH